MKGHARCRLAGVDGCRGGWIVAHTTGNIANAELEIVERWKDIHARFDVIAVDMPIGMSENGYRRCEIEARKILRPHGSRVFRVPARGVLAFARKDWAGANAWSKRQGCGGISKQSWNILPKIAEIDDVIMVDDQSRIFEAHPEIAFARLNADRALVTKHTHEGLIARRRLLRKAGFVQLNRWLDEDRPRKTKADDILDACVLLLTAARIQEGVAQPVTTATERDGRGLRMEIWR